MTTNAPLDSDGLFPWRYFVRALTAAFQLRVLLLAAVGVAFVAVMSPRETPPLAAEELERFSPADAVAESLLGPWQVCLSVVKSFEGGSRGLARSLAIASWQLAVWAIAGGAMVQLVARRLAFQDPPTTRIVLRAAATRWYVGIVPTLVTMLAAAVLLSPLWLHGILLHVPVLDFLSALLLPVPLLLALAAALLLGCLSINWPLVIAGAAIERPDPFDVLSTAFAFVTQRPIQLAAYLITATAAAMPVGLFAEWVSCLLAALSIPTLEASAGTALETSTTATRMIAFWLGEMLPRLPQVFYAAYFWSAVTAIYLLLRRDIDGRQVDEIES